MVKSFVSRFWLPLLASCTYLFLYLPIIILVVLSFNSSALPYQWESFSFKWYVDLFYEPEIFIALKNSLIVALSSVVLSLTMGLLFVYWGWQHKLYKLMPIFLAGVALPEIVMAVGLLSLFNLFSVSLGFATLIAGHTLLGLSFVIPIIRTQFLELDYSLTEASLDLGASDLQTFFKIILPLLMPALVAGGLLVFILSFDDFLISFFCAGPTSQTLSLYIFGMIRLGVSPIINALSAVMLAITSLLVIIFCSINISNRGL
jgi:spermidine/putrescine transport system permease protein